LRANAGNERKRRESQGLDFIQAGSRVSGFPLPVILVTKEKKRKRKRKENVRHLLRRI
jgi:hypothetical protein